jgi:hypothetical protein
VALTVKNLLKFALQPSEFIAIVQVTGDASYPNPNNTSSGYAVTPATFSLTTFAQTSDYGIGPGTANAAPPAATGYFIGADYALNGAAGGTYSEIDTVTGNLRMYAAAGTELANAASATAVSATLIAFGH